MLIVAIVLLVSAALRNLQQLSSKMDKLEQRLQTLATHSGLPEATPDVSRVLELLREGLHAEAVAAYRKITGVDLVRAKREVDNLSQ